MRRSIGFVLLVASVAWTVGAKSPRVSRAALADLERSFDQRIERYSIDDPFYLLGSTRGVYLEGYGVVFTAELNLVAGAVVTPFRPKFTPQQIEKLRSRKISRLPELKRAMRDMMITSATSLKTVPPEEQVIVGVTLFAYSWEDTTGLPAQIVMQAPRQSLLDIEAGRTKDPGVDAAIRIEEF